MSLQKKLRHKIKQSEVILAADVDALLAEKPTDDDKAETYRQGWKAGHAALDQENSLQIAEVAPAVVRLAKALHITKAGMVSTRPSYCCSALMR